MLLQQTVTLCLILLSFRAKKSSANQVKVIEEYEDRIAQYSAEVTFYDMTCILVFSVKLSFDFNSSRTLRT